MSFLGTGRRLTGARLALGLGVCLAAAALVAVVAPLVGASPGGGGFDLALLDLGAVWDGLTGEPTTESRIYLDARLPRVLAALVVGAALAAAGCAFQAVLRNPLAEPYTLGISSGSSLAAVLAIRLGLDGSVLGGSAIGIAAVAGAAVSVYVVWTLGRVGTSLPPATLILAGITVAMFCSAGTMLVQYTADLSEISRMVRWMMGSLDAVLYAELTRTAIAVAIGAVVLLALARDLNALSAGSDAAASVGVDPVRSPTIAFVAASLLVGASIALAGPIGFIGLVVPHALRAVVGPDHRLLLPASMLVGGTFLAVCDTVARTVVAPNQIPVGVLTALVGGPFFLYILVREKSRGGLWSA